MSYKLKYYAYEPIAKQYEHTTDPEECMNQQTFNPKSLSGKLVQWFLQFGSWAYMTYDLPNTDLVQAYNAMSIRVHNTILTFVEQYSIRNDLSMFNYNTAALAEGVRRGRSSAPQFSTEWSIKTKKEDCFVELCTHLTPVHWPIPFLERMKNRITHRGPISDNIPKLQYTLILKVFNSPASCYVIFLNGINVVVPFSETLLEKANVDFFEPTTITPAAKERYEQRFPYFRTRGRNIQAS